MFAESAMVHVFADERSFREHVIEYIQLEVIDKITVSDEWDDLQPQETF